jgi:hypothetical protein
MDGRSGVKGKIVGSIHKRMEKVKNGGNVHINTSSLDAQNERQMKI